MVDPRRQRLGEHLDRLRAMDGWHPFQNFVLGLLHRDGYRDVRHSNVRSDLGRDAMALTPDGKRCVVAVSFDCTRSKVLGDAKRWNEDPDREDATVMVFATTSAPTEKRWSPWRAAVLREVGLELRMVHRETILDIATRGEVWRETCARLGLPGERLGYRHVEPYDGDLVRAALQARPAEWLSAPVELEEWSQLGREVRSRLILGKPGSGKTTTLFAHLEEARPNRVLVVEPDLSEGGVGTLLDHAAGGGVIVFDDAHEKPNELRTLLSALQARQRDVPAVSERFLDVRLLIAARSQEWHDISGNLPLTTLQDLKLVGDARLNLRELSLAQCRELVESCRNEWGLAIEERLVDQAASAAASCDGTPLYVLSVLAPARLRPDRRLRDEDLAGLPADVLGLWRLYWSRLGPSEQGLLRLVKLFTLTQAPSAPDLFAASADAFWLTPHEVSASLAKLGTTLWLSRNGAVPTCLDVQLEAIELDANAIARWDSFVHELSADAQTKAALHVGTGNHHLMVLAHQSLSRDERAEALSAATRHYGAALRLAGEAVVPLRATALNNRSLCDAELAGLETTLEGRRARIQKAVDAVEEAVRIDRALGIQGDLAMSLNNASNLYSDLAGLETTREGRRAGIQKAVDAVEEAVRIRRVLGGQAHLASALNNAPKLYSDLAGLETTREGRRAGLQKAVDAVEEVVRIRTALGVQGELASALNNTSKLYSDLAGLETKREGRRTRIQAAVDAVEEAVRIYRALGVHGDLAGALNNASNRYSELAGLETTREGRRAAIQKAVDAVEEAVHIDRTLGVQGDLASALNNASNHYWDLVGLETTREGRRAGIQKAVDAVEEAVRIRRALGVQGDLASALNNASSLYAHLAGLETTVEGRRAGIQKAVDAVQEAVRIREALGAQGGLASALNNASNHYSDLAGLETTREDRRARMQKAVDAVEEAVRIYWALGVQGNLASALRNASLRHSDLAGLETTREDRRVGIQKAVDAVAEAIRIRRALGVQEDLAMSLGTRCQHLRKCALYRDEASARLTDLRASLESIEEATRLFREAGNVPYWLTSVEETVLTHVELGRAGVRLDAATVESLCSEGKALAESMEDHDRLAYFDRVMMSLSRNGAVE